MVVCYLFHILDFTAHIRYNGYKKIVEAHMNIDKGQNLLKEENTEDITEVTEMPNTKNPPLRYTVGGLGVALPRLLQTTPSP